MENGFHRKGELRMWCWKQPKHGELLEFGFPEELETREPKKEEKHIKDIWVLNLKLACEFGDLNTVKLSLENGTNPSDCDNIAIQTAHENGHIEIVKELLKDSRVVCAVE